MAFNFCRGTHFETPMVAPLISVFALEHLISKRSEFSSNQVAAVDALLNNLPSQRIKMRTSTRSNDAVWHELSTYNYDDYGDPDYYDSDKLMVCVCVPGVYSSTLDPVYSADVDLNFNPTDKGMGWGIINIAPHLKVLDDLCEMYDVTFNSEYVQNIIDFKNSSTKGEAFIHEFSAHDYAGGEGFVLYNHKKKAFFAGVIHNSTRTATLLGAKIFPSEHMGFAALDRHEKKDEWMAVPAQVHLNGMVPTEDTMLSDALGLAQKMRMDNHFLAEENAKLRAQLGLEENIKRPKL